MLQILTDRLQDSGKSNPASSRPSVIRRGKQQQHTWLRTADGYYLEMFRLRTGDWDLKACALKTLPRVTCRLPPAAPDTTYHVVYPKLKSQQ